MVDPSPAVASSSSLSSSSCLLIDSSIRTNSINNISDDDDRKLPAVDIKNVSNVVDLTGTSNTYDCNGQNEEEDGEHEETILRNGKRKRKTFFKSTKKQRREEGKNNIMNSCIDSDYKLALRLQKEEDHKRSDYERKRREQKQQAANSASSSTSQKDEDYIFAKKLYEEELASIEQEQEEQLGNTTTSKAWKFVQQVLKIVNPIQQQPSSTSFDIGTGNHPATATTTAAVATTSAAATAAAATATGMSSSMLKNDITTKTQHTTNTGIQPVAVDDMVWTAERILLAQENFRKCNKPTRIDIGYHYTMSSNLDRIRTDGLMSKSERDANNIHPSTYNGSAYGDGIYTANNPYAYQRYGDTGLLVARLCGNQVDYRISQNSNNTDNNNKHGSTIANPNSNQEIIVLKKSCQCVPIIQFQSSLIIPNQPQAIGNVRIRIIHEKLQKLIDDTFNNGIMTPIPTKTNYLCNNNNPSYHPHQSGRLNRAAIGRPAAIAPPTIASLTVPQQVQQQKQQHRHQQSLTTVQQRRTQKGQALRKRYLTRQQIALQQQGQQQKQVMNSNISSSSTATKTANCNGIQNDNNPSEKIIRYEARPVQLAADTKNIYKSFTAKVVVGSECAICLNILQKKSHRNKDVIQLISCGHIFHRNCINDCLLHSVNCPTCRKQITTPRGKMPSGTMTIKMVSTQYCSGEKDSKGSYVIKYNIPSGIQKKYHPNSGQYHGSAHRVAYLPNNENGRNLLKRLEFAFQHGLTFMVGTSLTTNQPNSVVWSSIHHKTSPSVGIHGFPDPGYFDNCNSEFLNVPKADAL